MKQDNLTPRLEEFKDFVNDPAIKNMNKKVEFVLPIVNENGNHWYGMVMQYDPNTPEKPFNYTFLDSNKQKDTPPPVSIQNKIETVFGVANIERNPNPIGFYTQGPVSCGPCSVENMMMNTGVIPPDFQEFMDVKLRQKHNGMVPELGWRHQKPQEAVADAMHLINSEEISKELLDSAKRDSQKQFEDLCNQYKSVLSDKGEAIEYLKINAKKIYFHGGQRVAAPNERGIQERLDQYNNLANNKEKEAKIDKSSLLPQKGSKKPNMEILAKEVKNREERPLAPKRVKKTK